MKAFKLLIISGIVSVCSASARADLTIEWIGAIVDGNSWSQPVTLGGANGFDILIAEVTVGGATFEAPSGLSISNPSGWTDTWHSPTLVSATGPASTSGFDLMLTFDDPQLTTGVSVVFSAFLPGFDSSAASVEMELKNGVFTPTSNFVGTSVTRSGLATAPVPGAVFLGMMGFGLVGLARKRLG